MYDLAPDIMVLGTLTSCRTSSGLAMRRDSGLHASAHSSGSTVRGDRIIFSAVITTSARVSLDATNLLRDKMV